MPDINALWDYNQPELTEHRFRELLPQADPATRLELLTQIARTYSLRRQFDEAHALLDEVAPAMAAYPLVEIRCHLERGRTFRSSGQPEQALPFFQQAYAVAQATGQDSYAVDALHMIALVVPPSEQIQWHLRALELAETSSDPAAQRWQGSLYNNLGWTYHDQGDDEQALAMFQKALRFREAQPQPGEVRIAKYMVARALRSLQRHEEALSILREIKTGEADGYILEEIAENLLITGGEARPYFAQAYAILSQEAGLVAQEPERITRLQQMSR